jgi:hypothetical protein
MGEFKNCLKNNMLAVWAKPDVDFGGVGSGIERSSKHVQLHIKWTVWIHKRMI